MGATKFQILSDLHLEVGNQYDSFKIPCCAPYLILAGDIGRLVDYDRYFSFLQRQCETFRKVFLVLGNHEFYGITREEGWTSVSKMESSIHNLILLQQNTVEVDGVLVLGCILGSWIPDEASTTVLQKVNDFRKIKDWTITRHNQAYEDDIAWLKNKLKTTQNSRVLLVTHYAPEISQTSAPDKVDSPITSAFATDLMNGNNPEFARVSTWIFGHTHYTTEFQVNGTRLISNQRGYVFPNNEPKTAWSLSTQLAKAIGRPNYKEYDVRRIIKV